MRFFESQTSSETLRYDPAVPLPFQKVPLSDGHYFYRSRSRPTMEYCFSTMIEFKRFYAALFEMTYLSLSNSFPTDAVSQAIRYYSLVLFVQTFTRKTSHDIYAGIAFSW